MVLPLIKICPDFEADIIVFFDYSIFFFNLIQIRVKKDPNAQEQTPSQVVEVNRGITVAELCHKLETDLGN